MRTRWMLAATVIGTLAGFSACAAGTDTGGLAGGPSSTSSHGDSDSGTGGTGTATGGAGGAVSTTSSTTSSTTTSSSTGTGGAGGASLCGNGVKDPGEQCDTTDFGGLTCQILGLGPGQLVCNTFCSIVATQCQPKENCLNNQDDNLNGLIDCEDPECDGSTACVDTCTPPASAVVPAYLSGNTSGRPAVHKASCSTASGKEVIYQVIAPVDGNLTARLFSFSGADFTLSVRTACGDDASEIACSNESTGSGSGEESLSVPVTAGAIYFVMVDGNGASDAGSFDLELNIPLPESDCQNHNDDDDDGYLDCDDADACQTFPECMPGAATVGAGCFFNGECSANQNDPICLQGFEGFPGGYCSEFCDQAADDCGPNGVCYAGLMLSVHGVCLLACTSDADCRPGYACNEKGLSQKVCTIAPESECSNYVDDDDNGLLDCADASCQATPACVPGDKAPGQPCTLSTECFANQNDPICLDAANTGFPGGYCSQFCTMFPDDCGLSGVCTVEGPGGAHVCMDACTTSAECRPGYNCLDFGYPKKICFP